MKMSNEAYDFWKRMVEIVLPAVGSLYYGLAQLYNWPYAEHVVGTISLLCTFLGTILFSSNKAYKAELEAQKILETPVEAFETVEEPNNVEAPKDVGESKEELGI